MSHAGLALPPQWLPCRRQPCWWPRERHDGHEGLSLGSPPQCPPLCLSLRLCEVMVAGHPVLLVRNKKEFSALGSRCPHYGAPLSKGNACPSWWGEAMLGRLAVTLLLWGFSVAGVLRGHRLRCPWHGACFNIKTGDIEEYPSLDCLPCFKVMCCSPSLVYVCPLCHPQVPDTDRGPRHTELHIGCFPGII